LLVVDESGDKFGFISQEAIERTLLFGVNLLETIFSGWLKFYCWKDYFRRDQMFLEHNFAMKSIKTVNV